MNITKENLSAVSKILKDRFNSLTVEETIKLSYEILSVIENQDTTILDIFTRQGKEG